MASYNIQSVGKDTITLYISGDSGYPYYRVYVEENGGSSVHDEYHTLTSGAGTVIISGLTPGTTYNINVAYSTAQTGGTWVGKQTRTTVSADVSFSITSTTIDSITVQINGDPYYPWYLVYCRTEDGQDLYPDRANFTTGYGTITVSGLYPGTKYIIGVGYSTDDNGYTNIPTTQTATTQTLSLSFDIKDIGGDYVTVDVAGDTSCRYYTVYIKETDSGSGVTGWFPQVLDLNNYTGLTSGSFSFTASGLSPGVNYTINILYSNSTGGGKEIGAQYFTTIAVYYAYLTFKANGGSGAPDKVYGENTGNMYVELYIPAETPTRANYAFAGWNTEQDGSGKTFAAGDKYTGYGSTTEPGVEHILYAIWITASGTGTVYVFNMDGSDKWVEAIPYIHNGTTWQQVIPYVYTDKWSTT